MQLNKSEFTFYRKYQNLSAYGRSISNFLKGQVITIASTLISLGLARTMVRGMHYVDRYIMVAIGNSSNCNDLCSSSFFELFGALYLIYHHYHTVLLL